MYNFLGFIKLINNLKTNFFHTFYKEYKFKICIKLNEMKINYKIFSNQLSTFYK